MQGTKLFLLLHLTIDQCPSLFSGSSHEQDNAQVDDDITTMRMESDAMTPLPVDRENYSVCAPSP